MEIFDSSSVWIMALGKTLVHSLWAGILFLSAVKLLFVLVAPRFALLRYRIASLMLFLFAGSMAVLFIYLYEPSGGSEATWAGIRTALPPNNPAVTGTDWLKLCCYYSTYLYFTGIFFYVLHTLSSFRQIRSIRKSGEPVRGAWLERFMEIREKSGKLPDVALLESDRIDTPFLSGFIRPAIVIPAGMIAQLPFSQVETILAHELFHLKRMDHVVNFFQRIAEILFFYNPAFRLLSGIVRKEREFCCDDMVLKVCPHPLDYARALYKLALTQRKSLSLVPAATGNHRGQLKNRIQRILNPATMKTNIREKLSAVAFLTGVFLIVAILSGFSSALSITRHNSQPEDWQGQTESPVLAQVFLPGVSPEPEPAPQPAPADQPDSIRPPDEPGAADMKADWERIKREVEAATTEALESIDWEAIKKDMEAARTEALESIDWEAIKKETEAARREVMESIDWEAIKKEMEAARTEVMESVDWDQIKQEMESVKIHMDSLLKDMELDIDRESFMKEMEELQMEIEIPESLEF